MRTVACVLWHVDCDLWNEKSAMKSCPHRTQESAMWTSSSRSTLMHRDLSITTERESHPGVPPPGGTATAGCDPMSIDPITPGERPDGSVWHSECGEAVSTHRVTDAPWAEHKPVSIMYTLRVWYCGFALLPMTEGTQMTKHIGRALAVLTGTMLAGAMLAAPASATTAQDDTELPSDHGASNASEYLSVTITVTDNCAAAITYTNSIPDEFSGSWAYWGDYRVGDEEGVPDSEFPPLPRDDNGDLIIEDYTDEHDHGVTPEEPIPSGPLAGEEFGLQYNPVLIHRGE